MWNANAVYNAVLSLRQDVFGAFRMHETCLSFGYMLPNHYIESSLSVTCPIQTQMFQTSVNLNTNSVRMHILTLVSPPDAAANVVTDCDFRIAKYVHVSRHVFAVQCFSSPQKWKIFFYLFII